MSLVVQQEDQFPLNALFLGSGSHTSSLDYGGSHTLNSDSSASATFTFTVNAMITVDGRVETILNLTDPMASTADSGGSESSQSDVRWCLAGLSTSSHEAVVSMLPSGRLTVVDGFIYTVDTALRLSCLPSLLLQQRPPAALSVAAVREATSCITVEPFPPPGARPPIATHPTPPRKPYRRILLGPAAPDENGHSDDLPPAAGDNTTSTPLPPSHQNPAAEEMIPPPSHSGN
ncbi:hypothetical protein EV421DRAFT_1917811 [Armillaria borealis]|uniref:Uncharacterized protein n=1 Tax=Armillaria borealis TaxID=47425 RepID=A0AA39IDB4_9AGAR|nr:hypothetical protein EV421DRAFT_1917811 [Armillaria borealis]